MIFLPTRRHDVVQAPGWRLLAGLVLCAIGSSAAADRAPDNVALPELDCLVEPYQVIDVGSARGIVKSVEVDRSATVSASDVLVRLDDAEQQATVRQARARARMSGDMKAREAALAFAQRKLDRISELFASDAISSYQRDEVQTELEVARQELRQAQEARDLARLDLERAHVALSQRTIRSPVDGIVVERFVGPGEFVNDTPLIRVAQMNPLRVEAIAPAALYGQVRAGMYAHVMTEAQVDAPLVAQVTIVDRLIDPASGTFGIRLELPNPDYAVPSGLNCRLQLEPLAAVSQPGADAAIVAHRAAPTPAGDANLADPASPSAVAAAARAAHQDVRAAATTDASENEASLASRRLAPRAPGGTRSLPAQPVASASANDLLASIGAGVVTPPLDPAADAACVTLGPIADETLWRKLQLALANEPVAITPRTDGQGNQIIGYFVVTRPAATLAHTRAQRDELRAAGISDLAILTRPPHARRISLGLYSSVQGAQQRKAQLDAGHPGLATEIVPRTRGGSAHWLDLAAPADVLDAQPWHSLAPHLAAVPCADGRVVADVKFGAR